MSEPDADNAIGLILRELGKLVGHVFVPIGTSSQTWATVKGQPDLNVIQAALGFLDGSVLERARQSFLQGSRNQAQEILSIAYPGLRFYMCPPMWDEFLRMIFPDHINSEAMYRHNSTLSAGGSLKKHAKAVSGKQKPRSETSPEQFKSRARWLDAARKRLGLTKNRLARLTGVSYTTITKILDGNNVYPSTLEKLRDAHIKGEQQPLKDLP